ncbi:Mn superoxide dismutase [Lactarius psammicola]|nr:Mn superoxide dismutase [Lactarius psammicola]
MLATTFRVPLVRSLAHRSAAIHTLPKLPYAYDALEPHISAEIMELHHSKHHQTYVNGLNAAEEAYFKAPSTREKIALQAALKFNGGGKPLLSPSAPAPYPFFSQQVTSTTHSFGRTLHRQGRRWKLKDGKLKAAIERDFGSVETFKKQFNAVTAGIQEVDPLLSAHVPIIGVDIWEHAFYLQYKNVKVDYLGAIGTSSTLRRLRLVSWRLPKPPNDGVVPQFFRHSTMLHTSSP